MHRAPVDTWGYTDIIYGLVMGAFGPLTALSRDEDCFSSWYIWGVSTIELSDFFGKSFDIEDTSDWAKLGVKVNLYGIELYTLLTVCLDELKVNKASPWHQNFGFLVKDIEIPTPPKVYRNQSKFVEAVILIVKMLQGILSVYMNWYSDFYYWGFGYSIGYLCSNIFIAINSWFNLGAFNP